MDASDSRKARPALAHYQTRCVEGATAARRRGEDSLIEAPTGAGKTPIIARLAAAAAREGKRVLILTHRKLLFSQMVGREESSSEKAQLGEIRYWGGVDCGQIADASMGGVNQEPLVVVGMVDSVASRLDILADYDVIEVDEVQHVSEDSATRDTMGSYSEIIDARPDAQLVGLTATTFRGDGDRLHPRLEAAHREVVAIEEARDAGRIVPAQTVIGKAPTTRGMTAKDLVIAEREGRLEKTASAVLREERGEEFYDHVVEDWDRLAERKKTIMFVDSVEEVRDMTRRLNERYGEGSAVCLHGGKNEDGKGRTDKQNRDAMTAYEYGGAGVLVACKMIGEGFDVPKTDVVMSLNASLSRLEMNQYVGRCVRSADGKSRGLFIDYGTASHRHGYIEHQHEMQNVDAMAAAGTLIGSARVFGRMAPVQKDEWRVAPGEKNSLFIRAMSGRYAIYNLDHEAQKAIGRRAAKNSGAMSNFKRLDHPQYGTKALTSQQLAKVLAEHSRSEAEFLARGEGLGSDAYRALCHDELERQSGAMDLVGRYDKMLSEGDQARRAALAASLQGSPDGNARRRMLQKALEEPKSGFEMVRRCLVLSEDVFAQCSERGDLPFGLTSEARALHESLSGEDIGGMKPASMRKEAMATAAAMRHFSKSVGDETLAKSIGSVSAPLEAGIARMTRELAQAKAKRQKVKT